jgi:hypothetical protein
MSPMMSMMTATARKRKNSNFAIPAAAEATPKNPKKAATTEIMKNINAQRNMMIHPLRLLK